MRTEAEMVGKDAAETERPRAMKKYFSEKRSTRHAQLNQLRLTQLGQQLMPLEAEYKRCQSEIACLVDKTKENKTSSEDLNGEFKRELENSAAQRKQEQVAVVKRVRKGAATY